MRISWPDLREEHAVVRARAADVYKQAITRQRVTTKALERVIDGLAHARGRKTVLLVTEGFVHDTQEGSFAEVVNAARRANAVVYFLDARLSPGGEMASAELGRAAVLAGGISARDRDIDTPLDQHARGATGAVSIAIDTGGDRLGSAQSLADNLRRVADESRAYYLLGYAPANPARDGRFREIKVRTSRPGLTVRARRGYYAPREGAPAAPEPGTLDADLQRALDSPFGGAAIPMRLASYVLGPAEGDKAKVLVVAEADPRQIRLESRDGRDTGAVESFFLVSSRSGETYHHESRLDLSLPPEARAQVEKTWLPVRHVFELPAGVYQVRSVVRDPSSGQMGSLLHDFEVEDPKRLRVTTPVLTDALVPGEGEPRPALLARRTFAAGGRLYGQFEVYGATPDPATGQPRVSAGHVLKRADGTILSRLEPTPVPPNPEGHLTRLLAISLRTAAQGPHELVLIVRDDVANTQVELTEPFEVQGTAPPAAAAPAAEIQAPTATALKVTQDAAGYRELVSSYAMRPADAALTLARWPPGARKGAAQTFRKDAAGTKDLLAAALLHTEAAFALPGREKENLEAARDFLERIGADERPDLTASWLVAVGRRMQYASRFEEASRHLGEALKLQPRNAEAHLALGAIQETVATLGLVSLREESAIFGSTGPPVGSESLPKFQAYAEREKRVQAAQDHFRSALQARPDLSEARLRLGRLAGHVGREGEALDQLGQVASSAPAPPEQRHLARLFLGQVHEGAGRLPEAVEQYRAALQGDPTSQAAAVALSYALGRSGGARPGGRSPPARAPGPPKRQRLDCVSPRLPR